MHVWYLEWCLACGVGTDLTILKNGKRRCVALRRYSELCHHPACERLSVPVASLAWCSWRERCWPSCRRGCGHGGNVSCIWRTPEFSLILEFLQIVGAGGILFEMVFQLNLNRYSSTISTSTSFSFLLFYSFIFLNRIYWVTLANTII